MSLFIFVGHVSAMDISLDQVRMCNTIKESLQNHPELWIVKSFELIYIPDAKKANELGNSPFPEVDDGVEMLINFDVYQVGYVHIKKPFKMEFDDEQKDMMIKEIKKFLYRHFRDQVGHLVDKEEQRKTPIIADPIVEKPLKNGGLNRL
jgi:hypothetical protein